MSKSVVVAWRNAVRDSNLTSTTKLVCFVLSTYMDRSGLAWPGRPTLAHGSTLDVRSVDAAIVRAERAGYLTVTRPDKGGRGKTNRYVAAVPQTANVVRLSEWQTAKLMQETANLMRVNSERGSPEVGLKEKKKTTADLKKEQQQWADFSCSRCGGDLDEDGYCFPCRLGHLNTKSARKKAAA